MGERILLTHGCSLSDPPLFVAAEAGIFADHGLGLGLGWARQLPRVDIPPYLETIFGRWPPLQPLGFVPGDQGRPADVVSLDIRADVLGQGERDEPVAAPDKTITRRTVGYE